MLENPFNTVDAVIDLRAGDCGKGAVVHALLKAANRQTGSYTHVVRTSGGKNAGHTIYNNGKKFVTHLIPAGVFFGVKSVIGAGCVLEPEGLMKEMKDLEDAGVNVRANLKICNNTHVVTKEHLIEDSNETKIGTTRTGNGPCYRDKYARTGIRALNGLKDYPVLENMLIDFRTEFYQSKVRNNVLIEGAQGFSLDIDWGDYPYVTSSNCGIASVIQNGFTPKSIRKIYGVLKAYDTYVGAKKFEPNDEVFSKLRELGAEYGSTTGRSRQCNWLNVEDTINAANMNGVTHLIIKKVDVLEQLGIFNTLDRSCKSIEEFCDYLTWRFLREIPTVTSKENIVFSRDKNGI